MTETTAFATCPLCEATCGLELRIGADDELLRVQGDREDVFSRGFISPRVAA